MRSGPAFRILDRRTVQALLVEIGAELPEIIRSAYVSFGAGDVVNPHSLFLHPPTPLAGRIIALPAGLFGGAQAMGIKWISSFPNNLSLGLERASAVIVLNDPHTGYPTALLEGAAISACRTAQSASLACGLLAPGKEGRAVSVIGCGLIARRTVAALTSSGWRFDQMHLFDIAPSRAEEFAREFRKNGIKTRVCQSARDAAARGAVIIFATTAGVPWFDDIGALEHHPVVLHLSLRDLAPRILRAANNYVDDFDHAARAGTSVELVAREAGGHDFISGSVSDLISGMVVSDPARTSIFSPFGLGMLDIAVANAVVRKAQTGGFGTDVTGFFSD